MTRAQPATPRTSVRRPYKLALSGHLAAEAIEFGALTLKLAETVYR